MAIPAASRTSGSRRGRGPISLVELGVPEAEPGVEQEHAPAMTDRVGHGHALLTGEGIVVRKPELAHLESDDLREPVDGQRRGPEVTGSTGPNRRGRAGADAGTAAGAASGCGGEGGIRTRDGLPRTAFPVRRHSPLGDLSERRHRLRGPLVTAARETSADRSWQGRVRAPERAHPRCVSEARRRERRQGPSGRAAYVAERAGFEPAVLSHTAFRERHHQPLGHLSAGEDTKPRGRAPIWVADAAGPVRRRE